MNHSVASLAGMQEKIRETDPAETVRCLMLFVLLAVNRARFLFSREMIVRYIAAIVFPKTEDNIQNLKISVCLSGHTRLPKKSSGSWAFLL